MLIKKEDRWILNISFFGFAFAITIIVFCIPNWMKSSEEVDWIWAVPMAICGAGILIYLLSLIVNGIYSMYDNHSKRSV